MSLALEEPPFSADVAWLRNSATVSLSGEVDIATAPELHDCLLEVVTQRPDNLVVDLARLRFLDCSGAAVLGRAGRHCCPPAPQWSCVPPTVWCAWCCG